MPIKIQMPIKSRDGYEVTDIDDFILQESERPRLTQTCDFSA
jgi:DNA-binding protein Fis